MAKDQSNTTVEKMNGIQRKRIETDLAEYRKQYQQMQVNLQAFSGAIQALERLLKEDSNGDK
ncbi:MAG: hypothetical protein SVR04_00065 [Spirochaetota bacterium]|jgi:exopolyphosphatase/pppGpp-phosphohydrolase|nr:hypothetical protein [Spirochaetota bacterium]